MNILNSVLIASILMGASNLVMASQTNSTQVGRYLTVVSKPKKAQVDLLSQNIQVHFSHEINTIGEAIQHLLRLSGYSLVPQNQINGAFKTTLTKPLPVIDRELGPMSLKEGLKVLAGPAFKLIEDPVNRTIAFNLKPEFAKRYASNNQQQNQKKVS